MLPPDFVVRMKQQLGANYPDFEASLDETPPVSIRLNPRKPSLSFNPCEAIAWCATGRYLPERPVFALDPRWHSGAYYVQEAASMLLSKVLDRQIDASKPLRALDLCAAPGGKSTLLAAHLSAESLLVCNEVIQSRVSVLRENITRWGSSNTVIVNHDPSVFSALPDFFDLILIDAPCSGEGLFRKDKASRTEWSVENVTQCAARQKRIVADCITALSPGGLLIYSTCTYNKNENDENVAWISREFDLDIVNQNLDFAEKTETGWQCYPHQTKGEGFFIAALRKKASEAPDETAHEPSKKRQKMSRNTGFNATKKYTLLDEKNRVALLPFIGDSENYDFYVKINEEVFAIKKSLAPYLAQLDEALQRKQIGIRVGEWRKGIFTPSHELALNELLNPSVQRVELPLEAALAYLRKNDFTLPAEAKTGWTVATFQGLPLGWLKVLPNRFNNYLPNEWRLRMA